MIHVKHFMDAVEESDGQRLWAFQRGSSQLAEVTLEINPSMFR